MSLTIANCVCPFCGCCCDDIEVRVQDGRIIGTRNACALGASKFLGYNHDRLPYPTIKVGNEARSVSLDEAIRKAAEILSKADYPAVYGFGSTSLEAITAALDLAEDLGALADNVSTICHGPSLEAVQNIGEVTSTLGVVRHRADLIVYWGSNPLHSHPRHMVRYGPMAKGRFRNGRADRKLVVVDVRRTLTARMADLFLQIKPGTDFEILTALRAYVKEIDLEVEEVEGVSAERIEELAELMMGCRFGTLFFGLGLTMSPGRNRNVEAALALVRDLNALTKFTIIPMRGHFNVEGANSAFTWRTGYPFGVDFSHGYPRYNPGETTFVDALNRGECDAALIVASDPISHLPRKTSERLMEIPTVVLDPHITPTTMAAEVAIPTAQVGIEASGTAYRMDGVPLDLRKLVDPPPGILTDEDVLRRIHRYVSGESP
ncbi:formylmethanofuran dehydrogenase subunit B [Candidatus Bathyarchaeota archaeon]|nr:formylmethanofuran dehydrogenase subunit B [Candidatus Bathyarchaeota archaeon]MBS7627676.1 formylmethanofuran dehydrogenase subunit B [Candidatus Bathyarchaeota archaeon]